MTSKRQLTLPGLPRLGTPPGDRMKRAKRDFTPAEFARALHRNGFQPECDSLLYVDPGGPTGARVHGAITRANPIRVARRATLARLLRERIKAEKLNRTGSRSRIANGEES